MWCLKLLLKIYFNVHKNDYLEKQGESEKNADKLKKPNIKGKMQDKINIIYILYFICIKFINIIIIMKGLYIYVFFDTAHLMYAFLGANINKHAKQISIKLQGESGLFAEISIG